MIILVTTPVDLSTAELLAALGQLVMRVSIAWLFLWPLPGLLRDWPGTVSATSLVYPMAKITTMAGVAVMILGALSVGLGIYGRVGGAALALYCVGGVLVHMALSRQPAALIDSLQLNGPDAQTAHAAAQIGQIGHVTSAWKNWVVAGSCAYIALAGTGRWSIVELVPTHLGGAHG